jgi:hypothetical protein
MGFLCRLVGFAAVSFTLGGCGASPAPAKDPAALLRNYAQALRAGDAERAWSMLDEDAKRETSFEAFRHWLRVNPAQATKLADMIERPSGPIVITTKVPIGEQDTVEYVERDGAVRIVLSSLDIYSQSSPTLALNSFVRAVKGHRYDVLLRLAPKADRAGLTEQSLAEVFEGPERANIAALVRSIELSLPSGRLDVQGNRATFDLGAGSELVLVSQDGAWTLEDYHPIIR